MPKNIDISSSETRKALEGAGLKEKEAVVYISLLQSGQTGASRVVRETGLHGQFVYDALDRLGERGLVQYVLVRGRRKYSAKNPRHLSEQLSERKRNLDELIKQLEASAIVANNQFEIFQGQESFVANEMETLKAMPKDGTVLVIGGEGDLYTEKCGASITELDYWRKKKNIKVRYLGAESQKQELAIRSENRLFSYRILPGVFQGSSNYGVYKELGVFGLYIFSDPVTSFMVRNQKISDNFASFFETLWKLGK